MFDTYSLIQLYIYLHVDFLLHNILKEVFINFEFTHTIYCLQCCIWLRDTAERGYQEAVKAFPECDSCQESLQGIQAHETGQPQEREHQQEAGRAWWVVREEGRGRVLWL